MNALIIWAINAAALITRLSQNGATDELKAAVKELQGQFKASLPKKDDGTAWTDADLAALKAQHDALTAAIVDRHTD